MKLTCVIIEDEPLAVEKLKGFIEKIPFLDLKGSFENPLQGMEFLKTENPHIIFLDIQMEHLTGIQMLESIAVNSYVIITSAYAEHALKGYELQVFDYLLKPYSFERLLASVNRVYKDLEKKSSYVAVQNIFVKTEYRLENVKVDDILYIEGMQGYLRIYLPEKKIMTKQALKSFFGQLPADRFIQVHKSWIVSVPKIESVERCRIKIGDRLIPLGDSFKTVFFERIKR
jgi:two-component system, LytTR family, response regulator